MQKYKKRWHYNPKINLSDHYQKIFFYKGFSVRQIELISFMNDRRPGAAKEFLKARSGKSKYNSQLVALVEGVLHALEMRHISKRGAFGEREKRGEYFKKENARAECTTYEVTKRLGFENLSSAARLAVRQERTRYLNEKERKHGHSRRVDSAHITRYDLEIIFHNLGLSKKEGMVFLLYGLKRTSKAQVARKMGVSEDTVKKFLERARAKIRNLSPDFVMGEGGYTLRPGTVVDETQRLITASMDEKHGVLTDQQKEIVDEFEAEDEVRQMQQKMRIKPKPQMAEIEGDENEEQY